MEPKKQRFRPVAELAWTGVEVGETIRTPFGDAVISDLNMMRMSVTTDLGEWELGEIAFREAPERAGDVAAFLLGPRFEVRSTVDMSNTACSCSCNGCSHVVQRHKLTKRETIRGHERTGGCNCEPQGCWCISTIPKDIP